MGTLSSNLRRGGSSTRDAIAQRSGPIFTQPQANMAAAAHARSQGIDMTRDESVESAPDDYPLPVIYQDEDLRSVIKKLSLYFRSVIELPSTFEQLRTTHAGACLNDLAKHLAETCQNPLIVNALLREQTLGESRAAACEIVAWRFLALLNDADAMRFCLREIPDPRRPSREDRGSGGGGSRCSPRPDDEESSLLLPPPAPALAPRPRTEPNGDHSLHHRRYAQAGSASSRRSLRPSSFAHLVVDDDDDATTWADGEADPAVAFRSLNALEIAVVASAKRFLGRRSVQRIVTGIWHGDIVFWDSLSVRAAKTPRLYDPRRAASTDAYSRLRVPKYLKTFEAFFFLIFLYLYYTVLIRRVTERITAAEGVLWVWIAAFCYDEFSEWLDAGSVFYVTDVWNVCDLIMMLLGCVFAALRITGVVQDSAAINNMAFDILALEALFLVPRMCSILSLNPSWGILIPCLKEMTMDFLKFMVIILIIYCGFLTTFSLLGRDHFSLMRMAGVLGKIFFGSSYVGFDIMRDIDPYLGPPLMIVFITMSTFLLMGSLAGLLANSFARVMSEAHAEYVYVYSVYVLEAATSNRLTHFYPPFNLLALLVFRPWRLVLRGDDDALRGGRIWLLKVTHAPIVAVIRLYEVLVPRGGAVDGLPRLVGSILDVPGGDGRTESWIDVDRTDRGHRRARRRRPVSQERTAVEQDLGGVDRVALEVQIGDLSRKLDKLTELVVEMKRREEFRYDKDDIE
ncbi:Ion transport [Cordyceps fumosorosea ARSEF 2679]|uniref:Ion transport n=1 Tax=Cordyceps fumosorosea (strain ARSEF 2679) TaxID=1081104 RepID=A0A167TP09_CORFA|nr:Ion transport [Cordyceps fumosorosea ARSEF 2679]OAA60797.1 Ion transport [Cordyceps fumosorosea ARSEF 2679]